MNITNRIKQIMEHENLNITQFSDIIGVKRQQMQDITLGRQKPPQELLAKIVDILHIDANWLLTGKGEMYRTETQEPRLNPISDHRAEKIVELYEALNDSQQKEILAAIKEKKRMNQLEERLDQLQKKIG